MEPRYYERVFDSGRVVFRVDDHGDWRKDGHTWVPLEGMPIRGDLITGDTSLDRIETPE